MSFWNYRNSGGECAVQFYVCSQNTSYDPKCIRRARSQHGTLNTRFKSILCNKVNSKFGKKRKKKKEKLREEIAWVCSGTWQRLSGTPWSNLFTVLVTWTGQAGIIMTAKPLSTARDCFTIRPTTYHQHVPTSNNTRRGRMWLSVTTANDDYTDPTRKLSPTRQHSPTHLPLHHDGNTVHNPAEIKVGWIQWFKPD